MAENNTMLIQLWASNANVGAIRFLHRHGDAELLALLQTTVPPCDLNKVSMFFGHLEKFQQQAMSCQTLN